MDFVVIFVVVVVVVIVVLDVIVVVVVIVVEIVAASRGVSEQDRAVPKLTVFTGTIETTGTTMGGPSVGVVRAD